MKRRLNMAAGMIHRPKIVLMDEPTVGVDPQSRNRIFEMIEALRGEGRSIIYTTHYMEEAERLCDRVAIIDHGRIIARARATNWCERTFGSRSQVLAEFDGRATNCPPRGWSGTAGAAWARRRSSPSSIPPRLRGCWMTAAKAGLTLEDVSLRRPNLESVFLHLTGRELRD